MSGRPWTAADLRTLRTLRSIGDFSNELIGAQLGRSAKAVSKMGRAIEREQQRVEAARNPRRIFSVKQEAA